MIEIAVSLMAERAKNTPRDTEDSEIYYTFGKSFDDRSYTNHVALI